MSQHSQRTQFGPSTASIVAMSVLTGASVLATGYLTSGPLGGHMVIGAILGVLGTGLLLARVLGLMTERAVIQDRMDREAERDLRERVRDERYRRWMARREDREREQDEEDQRWLDAGRVAGSVGVEEQDSALTAFVEETRSWAERQPAPADPHLGRPWPDPNHQDEGPVVYPQPSPAAVARWAAAAEPVAREVDQVVTGYLDEELDPAGYPVAEPVAVPRYTGWGSQVPEEPARSLVVHDPGPGSPLPYVVALAARATVAVPLPPREYVDPGPFSAFVPRATALEAAPVTVPVSPGYQDQSVQPAQYGPDCDGTCLSDECPAYVDRRDRAPGDWPGDATEVFARVEDDSTQVFGQVEADSTEVFDRVEEDSTLVMQQVRMAREDQVTSRAQ